MREIKGTWNIEINPSPRQQRSGKKSICADKIFVLLFMLLSVVSSCQESKMNEKKQVWAGAVVAPKEYPVEIYNGALSSNEYAYNFGPIYGILKQGWSSSGKSMGRPDTPIEFPDELKMTWYAIQEQKFYTGNWKLDKEQISKVWQEGSLNVKTGTKEEFETLIVGLAPGGNVALWAEGARQVLLATFQAHDTTINKETANPDFEHFFRQEYRNAAYTPEKLYGTELYAQLQGKGWPDPKLYLDYNKKYAWKFAVEGIGIGPKDYFYYECFNGERDQLLNTSDGNTDLPKAIPEHISVKWQDSKQQHWVADTRFKYDVIKKAFEQFDPAEKIDLLIQVDIASNVLNTYLKSSSKQVKIVGYDLALVPVDN